MEEGNKDKRDILDNFKKLLQEGKLRFPDNSFFRNELWMPLVPPERKPLGDFKGVGFVVDDSLKNDEWCIASDPAFPEAPLRSYTMTNVATYSDGKTEMSKEDLEKGLDLLHEAMKKRQEQNAAEMFKIKVDEPEKFDLFKDDIRWGRSFSGYNYNYSGSSYVVPTAYESGGGWSSKKRNLNWSEQWDDWRNHEDYKQGWLYRLLRKALDIFHRP